VQDLDADGDLDIGVAPQRRHAEHRLLLRPLQRADRDHAGRRAKG
jgi:hypothetical protein